MFVFVPVPDLVRQRLVQEAEWPELHLDGDAPPPIELGQVFRELFEGVFQGVHVVRRFAHGDGTEDLDLGGLHILGDVFHVLALHWKERGF